MVRIAQQLIAHSGYCCSMNRADIARSKGVPIRGSCTKATKDFASAGVHFSRGKVGCSKTWKHQQTFCLFVKLTTESLCFGIYNLERADKRVSFTRHGADCRLRMSERTLIDLGIYCCLTPVHYCLLESILDGDNAKKRPGRPPCFRSNIIFKYSTISKMVRQTVPLIDPHGTFVLFPRAR